MIKVIVIHGEPAGMVFQDGLDDLSVFNENQDFRLEDQSNPA